MTPDRDAMPATPAWPGRVALAIAGILTTGMGLYHFCLPFVFRWGDALARVPMLHWALFSINAFMSYFLVAGGAMTTAIALQSGPRDRTARWILLTVAGSWLLNLAYQIVLPMPTPPRLALLRWSLFGFAAAVLLLQVIGLAWPSPRPATPGPALPVRGRPR